MAGKLQEVFDATDRAVVEIRTQAETEAANYLETRRREADRLVEDRFAGFWEMSDDLLQRVDRAKLDILEVERGLKDLVSRLATLRGEMAAPPSTSSVSAPAETAEEAVELEEAEDFEEPEAPEAEVAVDEDLDDVEPVEAPAASGGPSTGPAHHAATSAFEEAMLRATQMAVAGSSREEIETVLRNEYRMRAPGPIVDEILGPDPA
jgi:hypothetical protein